MDSYKKCPLKKRPINYDIEIESEPENLSTKPEDLSTKPRRYEDFGPEAKRSRVIFDADHYNNPVNWSSSFARNDTEHRSLSPSTDSYISTDYYRESSLSPPAVFPSYQNTIHLRGLNRQQQIDASRQIESELCCKIPHNIHHPGHHLHEPITYAQNEPQDLSLKSCIPIPALYHNFGDGRSPSSSSSSQDKSKINHRFNCHDCGKSYTTFSGLSKHQQFHCPAAQCNQIKRVYNCEHCDKSYTTSGALKMHIRTHTLPCKCLTCGKAFSRPWLLQGHIRTHTGEKPFKCQYCARAFADRSNLRAHLQTHAEIKKYVCESCNKSFSRMSLLSKHTAGGCLPIPYQEQCYQSTIYVD